MEYGRVAQFSIGHVLGDVIDALEARALGHSARKCMHCVRLLIGRSTPGCTCTPPTTARSCHSRPFSFGRANMMRMRHNTVQGRRGGLVAVCVGADGRAV